jgi:hypothetical protein
VCEHDLRLEELRPGRVAALREIDAGVLGDRSHGGRGDLPSRPVGSPGRVRGGQPKHRVRGSGRASSEMIAGPIIGVGAW